MEVGGEGGALTTRDNYEFCNEIIDGYFFLMNADSGFDCGEKIHFF